MANYRVRKLVFVLVGTTFALGTTDGYAQSRARRRLGTVGYHEGVGVSSVSQTFAPYSYGIGSLKSPRPGAGGNVLSSSIGRGGSFSIRSAGSAHGSGTAGSLVGAAPTGGRLYNPGGNLIHTTIIGGGGLSQALLSMDSSAIGAASAYLSTIGTGSEGTLAGRDRPITSLVPTEPSRYRDFMEGGEKAFKAGEFQQAYLEFQLANLIGHDDPESFLSMAQAAFGRSLFAYTEAAFYLRRALTVLPELALVPLQPKAFYGDSSDAADRYAEHQMRLSAHLQTAPTDTDGQLMLAYYRWFEGDVSTAREALNRAMRAGRNMKDEKIVEAVSVFWDGMVASGKVSGKLEATTRPAATTTPAADARGQSTGSAAKAPEP